MNLKNNIILTILLATGLMSIEQSAMADVFSGYATKTQLSTLNEQQKKGLSIAIEQDLVDKGWQDSQSNMTMLLRNANGKESRRELQVKAMEINGDGDKSITIFNTPKDVKGTVFLTYSHIEGDDDQWLYLPALKRVKRINSRNKSGPFMGSEFAFEDLVSFEVAKFEFNYLKSETLNGVDCYVVERFPKDKNSGYTRIVSWIEKQHKRVMKSEFYDRKESLLKTLQASNYKLYLEQYWRANTLLMTNHQTGKSTELTFSNISLNNDLDETSFSKNSLKRAR